MPCKLPSNRDIFRLFCTLEKGELRNLRVLLCMEGRRELVHDRLVDELYKLRDEEFEAMSLCERLDCETQTLRRAMLRIYRLVLQSRTHYHPEPHEALAKTLADVRYLLRKDMNEMASQELKRGLAQARELEMFEMEVDLLGLRIGLPNSSRAEIEALQGEIRLAEQKRDNLRELESLKSRLKGVRLGPDGKDGMLKARSLAGHHLLESSENCLSTRARILFHDLKYRLGVFLGNLSAAAKHLHEKIRLLENIGEALQFDERSLLQSRIALSRLLFEQGETQAALHWSSVIWNSDLSNAMLEPIRLEAYTASMLAFATDHLEVKAGNAVLRILLDQWGKAALGLDTEKRSRLRFMALRFLLFSGQYGEVQDFARQTLSSPFHERQEFDLFSLALELLATVASDSFDRAAELAGQLAKQLRAQNESEFQAVGVGLRLAKKYLSANLGEFPAIARAMQSDLPDPDTYEMQALRLDAFLDSLLRGCSVFDLDAQSGSQGQVRRFLPGI